MYRTAYDHVDEGVCFMKKLEDWMPEKQLFFGYKMPEKQLPKMNKNFFFSKLVKAKAIW